MMGEDGLHMKIIKSRFLFLSLMGASLEWLGTTEHQKPVANDGGEDKQKIMKKETQRSTLSSL